MSCCHLASLIGFIAAAQLCAADHVAYVSLAGENRIQTYRFNDDSGDLKYLDNVVTPGPPGFKRSNTCADLELSPSGKWMVVAGQKSGKAATYRIDPDTPRSAQPEGAGRRHAACGVTRRLNTHEGIRPPRALHPTRRRSRQMVNLFLSNPI